MKAVVILLMVLLSARASPLQTSQQSNEKTSQDLEESKDNTSGKSTSIAENLKKIKELVLEKLEQMKQARKIETRQTKETESADRKMEQKIDESMPRARGRNSKVMMFEEKKEEMMEQQPNKENIELVDEEMETSKTNETEMEEDMKTSQRKQKNLNFYPYVPEHFYNYEYNPSLGYFYPSPKNYATAYGLNVPEEWLSRTEPFKRKNTQQFVDSPIYYIRLPPSPYVFVPGVGYVSRPPSLNEPEVLNSIPDSSEAQKPDKKPNDSPFIHVPINFVSNGKPTSVYQLPNDPISKPMQKPDSSLINLDKGPYFFNGRPVDIYILRNSYNSLYHEALTNFYP